MDMADFIADANKAFGFALLPILYSICEANGWKATLTVAGPELDYGGSLKIAEYDQVSTYFRVFTFVCS
jgi:hypothetical protein